MFVTLLLVLSPGLPLLLAGDRPPSPPTNGHSMSGPTQGLTVNTTSGVLQGSKSILNDDIHVTSWLGIPFADPPVSELRFRPPRPVTPWSGIREAVKMPPACPQSSKFSVASSNDTSEDCLYLNIFSAEPHDGAPKPVMIWIHPGEFNYGSASSVSPARLSASGEVIVVSLQYRLGALGFLYTGEEDVTNLGLRDQLMAIDWISHNILHFGGDPTRVTLFGSEAGAVSASYHVGNVHVSGAGLVHAAILQSGGPHSPWARQQPGLARARTRRLASRLGCADQAELASCLQSVSVDQILEEQNSVCDLDIVTPNCFVPVEDGETVPSSQAEETQTSAKVMYGHNSNEGFLKLMQFLTREFPTEKLYTEGFSQEIFLKMLSRMFPNADEKTRAMISFLYEDLEAPTEASRRFLRLEKIVSDFMSTCTGPTANDSYRYLFSWQPSKDKWPRWSGVKQGDEIQFVFGEPVDSPGDYLIEEKEFSKALMKLWTEFARTGALVNVTGLTLPSSDPGPRVIQLSALKSGLVARSGKQEQKCRFWNGLFNQLSKMKESTCEVTESKQHSEEEETVSKMEQMDSEIQTNEISQIPPSYRKSSQIFIEESMPKSSRKERGIYQDSFSYPEQFFYKVKSKVSKQKGTAATVLERSRKPVRVYKRQTPGQPENNTQLSYQLSVGLNNGNNQGEPFAVYNTQQLGNSPIYIAPNKYDDRENLNDYRDATNFVRNTQTPLTVAPWPVKTTRPSTFHNTKSPSQLDFQKPPTDHRYSQGYDPFFPGFGAKIRSPVKASVSKEPVPVVKLKNNQNEHRAYFPI